MDVGVNAPRNIFMPLSSSSACTRFRNHGRIYLCSSTPLLVGSVGGRISLFRGRILVRHHRSCNFSSIHNRCQHKPRSTNSISNCNADDASTSSRSFSSVSTRCTPSSSACVLSLDVREMKERCDKWQWRGHTINYLMYQGREDERGKNNRNDNVSPSSDSKSDSYPPLLLVHGFGASIAHWRRNIRPLAQSYTIYAIDLLGFGASDKPIGFAYTMEVWAQLILDFLGEIVQRPTVLIGNSVGSLACVIAAAESTQTVVRGLVLLNCAGGMNNKAIVDDWRIKLLLPLLWFFDFLLKQRVIASVIFERVKERDNLRNILLSVYGNKESVDEDLVEIIRKPAHDEGALDAFVSIVTGPPGPNPVQLMPRITLPVLVLWGDEDPFTPLNGPVGKYFRSLDSHFPNINLFVLEGIGHCPHDDGPDLVHQKLLPWLDNLPA